MDTRLYRMETVRGIGVSLNSVSEEKIIQLVETIRQSNRVFFTGAGRSFLMIKAIAMAMMQIGITTYVTGGVTTPAIGAGDLLIAASCSGETKSVSLFLEQAKKEGVKVALITANSGSTMAKMADIVVEMQASSEPGSVQETWITDNRFEQAIVPLGDCLVEYLARGKGASDHTISENHANME